ncbi:MAG: amidase [Bacillota bacterium]
MVGNFNNLPEIANALRKGMLKLENYINETCDLIDELEPEIHALLPENDRRQRLLQEAQRLKAMYPSEGSRPPLYGVLVGIKDIFSVQDFPTSAGSKLPSHLFAGPEAVSVQILKEAGALVLGKTVTTEFAYFSPGPTRNPLNREHTPGGSSSGSAAAVAAGYCPLALGTQTIGSIIRPAAYCGIIGFKPSFDRTPTGGLVYFSPSSDHVGMFTQDIAGMQLAASLLCQDWQLAKDNISKLPVLGIPEGPYLLQAEQEALESFEGQIKLLEDAGYRVKRIPVFYNIEEINERHRALGAGEMVRIHRQWFDAYSHLYSIHSKDVYNKGTKISDDELANLQTRGLQLREELKTIMDLEGIDLWLSPSATNTAPKGLSSTGNPIMNLPWTHAGMPVLSVPGGKDKNQLPFGLQLCSRFWQDEELLIWGEGIGAVLG